MYGILYKRHSHTFWIWLWIFVWYSRSKRFRVFVSVYLSVRLALSCFQLERCLGDYEIYKHFYLRLWYYLNCLIWCYGPKRITICWVFDGFLDPVRVYMSIYLYIYIWMGEWVNELEKFQIEGDKWMTKLFCCCCCWCGGCIIAPSQLAIVIIRIFIVILCTHSMNTQKRDKCLRARRTTKKYIAKPHYPACIQLQIISFLKEWRNKKKQTDIWRDN